MGFGGMSESELEPYLGKSVIVSGVEDGTNDLVTWMGELLEIPYQERETADEADLWQYPPRYALSTRVSDGIYIFGKYFPVQTRVQDPRLLETITVQRVEEVMKGDSTMRYTIRKRELVLEVGEKIWDKFQRVLGRN